VSEGLHQTAGRRLEKLATFDGNWAGAEVMELYSAEMSKAKFDG
jgi:hypothetical protein